MIIDLLKSNGAVRSLDENSTYLIHITVYKNTLFIYLHMSGFHRFKYHLEILSTLCDKASSPSLPITMRDQK